MTPEQRAEAITAGWTSITVATRTDDTEYSCVMQINVGGAMVPVVTQQIADAIRDAVAAERKACATLVETGKVVGWEDVDETGHLESHDNGKDTLRAAARAIRDRPDLSKGETP